MSEWITKSADELAQALADGEVTSVELTQAHLDRIAAVDGDAEAGVHAFLHVDAEGALAQAQASDERRAAGAPGQVTRQKRLRGGGARLGARADPIPRSRRRASSGGSSPPHSPV